MHVIETENKTLDDVMKDMESKTRQILRKNERSGIHTREISKEELPLFKDIMQHTSDRREFVDRPLSYYENMWDALHDAGILKILVAEIDFTEFEKNTKEELETNKKELEDRIYKKENKKKNIMVTFSVNLNIRKTISLNLSIRIIKSLTYLLQALSQLC